MIELVDVAWTYAHAAQPTLQGVSLRIRPGEFVVLCGASGSGKSTLLRTMNGLIPLFHEGVLDGRIRVDGMISREVRLDQLGEVVGTVLQHPRRQFFADTAEEEIAFGMENLGWEPARIRASVADMRQALADGVPAGVRLPHLSGGQQQQVAIAASCAHGPRVLLLDEPSSNLSADAVRRLVATLARLRAEGVTVVIAEHRLRYLEGLVDRIVVMKDGRVDREWSAADFARLSDDELAAEGLRGEVRPVELADADADAGAGGLELEGVRCVLRGREVLSIERLAFRRGEVTAVRGVNGAGKSTLARIVAGLQRSQGTIRLDGRRLGRRARQRRTAIVMQDVQRQLFTDSVEAELALAVPEEEADAAEGVLAELDLAHLADRHPLSLSGGQQQRLIVATARLAGRPIVIFDEPSSGVDRRHLQSISDQIRAVADAGAVVLLISHDDDLLALAADRQAVLMPCDAPTTPAADPMSSAQPMPS